MYRIFEIQDEVRVPPRLFSLGPEEAIKQSLRESVENRWFDNVGVVLAVTDVSKVGEGRIRPGDGAGYFEVTYKALSFLPEVHEVLDGEVVDVADFGAFIRIGPLDAICHISQLMDDKVSFDEENMMFHGSKTKKTVKVGDIVRLRISSIGFKRSQLKIATTMRSPYLGNLKRIEQERKRKK